MTLKIPTKASTADGASASKANASPPGADGARTHVPRSEGQRLLLEVEGSLAQMALAIGTSKQRVHDWRAGTRMPGPQFREAIRAAYGIAPTAWDTPPGGEAAAEGPSPTATRSPTTPRPRAPLPPVPSSPSAGEDLEDLIAFLRGELARPDIIASERLKITASMTRALALRHRFEVEQALLEDRIIREHPAWVRVQAALVRALQDHPAAAQAVVDALAQLGFDR